MSTDPRHNDPAFRGFNSNTIDRVLKTEDQMAATERRQEAQKSHDLGNKIEDAARHLHDGMDKSERSQLREELNHFAIHGK
jgi:hypothetical protein